MRRSSLAHPQRRSDVAQAVDSAKRFPFKNDAPKAGKAEARVQVGYMLKRMDVVNLSSETWTNVEIWINQQYVVFVPKLEPNKLEQLNFQMFYDEAGHYFPKDKSTDNESLIKSLDMYRDGKMYEIPMQLGD
jgi:hypothetical protein